MCLFAKGVIRKKTKGSYKDKEGNSNSTYELSVDNDNFDYPERVNVTKEIFDSYDKGEEVELPVTVRSFQTSSGQPFQRITAIKIEDEEDSNE